MTILTYERINIKKKCINVWRINVLTYEYVNVWMYGLQRHKMHHVKYPLAVSRSCDERYKQHAYIAWVLKLIQC